MADDEELRPHTGPASDQPGGDPDDVPAIESGSVLGSAPIQLPNEVDGIDDAPNPLSDQPDEDGGVEDGDDDSDNDEDDEPPAIGGVIPDAHAGDVASEDEPPAFSSPAADATLGRADVGDIIAGIVAADAEPAAAPQRGGRQAGVAPAAAEAASAAPADAVPVRPAAPPAAAAIEQPESKEEKYQRITEELNRRPAIRVMPEQDLVAVTVGEEELTFPYPETLSEQERRQFADRIQTIVDSIEFDFKASKSPTMNLRFRRRADRELRDVSGEEGVPADYSTLLALLRRVGNTNTLPQDTPTEAQERSAHLERNALVATRLEKLIKKAIELNPTGAARRPGQAGTTPERRPELAQVLAVNFSFRAVGDALEHNVGGIAKKITVSETLEKDKTKRAAFLRELQAFSTPGRVGFFLDATKSEVDVIGVGAIGGAISIAGHADFLDLHNQLADLRKKGVAIPGAQQARYNDKLNRMLSSVIEQLAQKALADYESRNAPTPAVAEAQARAETTAGKFDTRLTQRIAHAKREARGLEIVRNLPVVKQIADFFTGYRRHAKWTAVVSLGALGASLGLAASSLLFPPGAAALGGAAALVEGFRRFIAGPVTFLSLFDLMQRGAEKKQRGAQGLLRTMKPEELSALTREQVFEHMAAIEIDRKIKNVDIEKWLSKNFKPTMGDEYETNLGTTYLALQDRLKTFAQESYASEETAIKAQSLSPEEEKARLERALNGNLDRMIKEVSDRKGGKAFQQMGGVALRFLTAAAGGWFVGSGRFAQAVGGALHAATHGQETLQSLAKFFHLDRFFGSASSVVGLPQNPSAPIPHPEAGLVRTVLPGHGPAMTAGGPGDTLVSTDSGGGGPRRIIDGPGAPGVETAAQANNPSVPGSNPAPAVTPPVEALPSGSMSEYLKNHHLLTQRGYSFYEVPGNPEWIQTKITSSPDLYRTLRRVVMDSTALQGHFNAVDAGRVENAVSNLYRLLHDHTVAGFKPSDIGSFAKLDSGALTIYKYNELSGFIDHQLMNHAAEAVKDGHAQAVQYALGPGEHFWQNLINVRHPGSGINVDFSDAVRHATESGAQAGNYVPGAPAASAPVGPRGVPPLAGGRSSAELFAAGMARVNDWHQQLVSQWGIEPIKIHANLDSVVLSMEQAIREGKGNTSAALSYINDLAAKHAIHYELAPDAIKKALSEKGVHLHDNIRALVNAFSTPTGKEFELFFNNDTHKIAPVINNPTPGTMAA